MAVSAAAGLADALLLPTDQLFQEHPAVTVGEKDEERVRFDIRMR